MEADQTYAPVIQERVDKLKTLSMVRNAHNLSQPIIKQDDDEKEITIINALKSEPRLLRLYFRARGLVMNPETKQLEQVRTPYMNVDGAYLLVDVVSMIAEEGEWSNFEQEYIPTYIDHFYEENLPYFTFWYEDYELNPKNFPFIMNALKMFALSTFYKAKGGKLLNVIGKTYSEDLLGKAINTNMPDKRGFLEKNNPFRKL